jgi:hypothetical protein
MTIDPAGLLLVPKGLSTVLRQVWGHCCGLLDDWRMFDGCGLSMAGVGSLLRPFGRLELEYGGCEVIAAACYMHVARVWQVWGHCCGLLDAWSLSMAGVMSLLQWTHCFASGRVGHVRVSAAACRSQ